MFPSCKRLNALLNVCDNEKNQSSRTYLLFLQGKLKELKKNTIDILQSKGFCTTYKKSHVYRIIKNIFTHRIVTRLQLMSILRIYGII